MWNYGKVILTNGEGTLELKDNKNRVLLAVKPIIDGSYMIEEATRPLNAYVQNPDFGRQNEEGFQAPVFKYDSVNFSGYFKGYTPRMNQKTISIHVDDILAGNGYSTMAKLDDKGFFSVKLPVYYPHPVIINSVGTGQQVFLESGKDLFVLFDNTHNTKLYMGKSGNVNRDLDKLDKFNSLDFSSILKKMPDLTSAQFKSECLDLMHKELDALDAFREAYSIGSKAYQVKKRDTEFRFDTYLLQYNDLTYRAMFVKNKTTEKPTVFKTEKFSVEYYDFIKDENVNDPLAVTSKNYGNFLSKLVITDFFRGEKLSYLAVMKALENSGHSLTSEEKKLREDLKIAENPEEKEAEENFYQKYGAKGSEINSKYSDQFKAFIPRMREGILTTKMAVDSLIKKGVNFSKDEKTYYDQLITIENLPAMVKWREIWKIREKFYLDHEEFWESLQRQRDKITREENLGKLGVKKGLALDIINAKKVFQRVANELIPLPDEELKSIRSQLKTPFIGDYLVMSNNATKKRIEANKKREGSVVNEAPKIAKEKLFEELMRKYTGKVVLVDFWATWCGPCMAGIERIKSLKEEMSKEKVVFVYITDPSSPKQTFDNKVPDIKGEHYRVSNEEWQYLCSKFEFIGIPHQVLVDKKGKVINPDLKLSTNDALKKELEKRINE